MLVLHIASIKLGQDSGMGRIGYEWKRAFERAGHTFIHIGLEEITISVHYLLYGYYVRKYIKKNNLKPDLILAHEPTSGFLSFKGTPLVVFSHGVEERAWEVQYQYNYFTPSFKNRSVPLFIRFFPHTQGYRKCTAALLSNEQDRDFLRKKGIDSRKLNIFHNGHYSFKRTQEKKEKVISVLYNATWIPRKGVRLMYEVFNKLLSKYPSLQLILAGTHYPPAVILEGFIPSVHAQIITIASFTSEEEISLYEDANIFVIPSFFEGQSLALTQAMSMGLCCVAADNSGQKDYIKTNENGLLFRTGDGSDMLQKLEYLINNPEQIEIMGAKGNQSVITLTWDNVTNNVVKVCEQAIQQ